MAVADAAGFPLAVYVASASPHEITLGEDTFDCTFTNALPMLLIGDKAYDSNKLDARLKEDWSISVPLAGERFWSVPFSRAIGWRNRLTSRRVKPEKNHES